MRNSGDLCSAKDIRLSRKLLSFCLILFLLPVWGCATKEEKIAQFMEKGDRLLAQGDTERALVEYMNALQLNPKNTRAMFAAGKVYAARKEYPRAYGAFLGAVEVDPDFDEARLQMASLLVMGGQGQMALEECDKVKNPDAHQPALDIVRAKALIGLKKYGEALEIAHKIPGMDSNTEVQAILAFCLKQQDQYDGMEKAVLRWRSLEPKDPSSYLFLAQHAVDLKDNARADEELQKMVAANPENKQLALFRAQALDRLGMVREAREAFDRLPPEPAYLTAKSDFYRGQGEKDKAKAILQAILAQSPGDAEAGIKLAQIFASENDREAAFRSLEEALRQNPKKADREKIILARAALHGSTGRWNEVKSDCEGILKENQGNMDAHLLLGKALMNLGQFEEAEIHLNQVAPAHPTDTEAQILLARAQSLSRKETLAGDTLKKALKANPMNLQIRMELVRYHVSNKEPDQATKLLEDGRRLHPEELLILKAMGEIEVSRKNDPKAEQAFREMVRIQPESPLGYMQMGQLLLARSAPREALQWLQQAMGCENGWQMALPAMVDAYLALGQSKSALALAEGKARELPASPLASFYLAQTLVRQGDPAQAEKAFLKCIELSPYWLDPYGALAEVYIKQGKIEEALSRLKELYEKRPSVSTGLQAAILSEYNGNHETAIQIYNDLLNRFGQTPAIMNNLAYLYAERPSQKEELSRALDLANSALTLQPENPNFMDTVSWVSYKSGNLDNAWKYFQDATGRAPEVGIFNLHGAIIARERGDKALSQNLLEKALGQNLDNASREKALALKKDWE